MTERTKHLVQSQPAFFLDFEASSLSAISWPIEIGIARVVGGEVVTGSRLIKPHPDWDDAGWSEISAQVHGLSRAYLEAEGDDPQRVAQWFKTENNGIAITDNPEFERRWLIRLLETDLPFPKVQLLDFDSYVRMSLIEEAAIARVYQSLETPGSPPHRAGQDAARLAKAWLSGYEGIKNYVE
ncbi:exonuclease domain-containing protein [Ruegeria arenilitoris]|uniref:exonuclease domain-containing protein n=1 Tax=Ruegeria arenilitoris TaxID=1173585 RepID=UPI00147C0505|nr:exonuclease domain-containing protein [Ruegeria arenilitoris]